MFKYLAVVVSCLVLVEIESKTWHTSQVMLRELYNLQKEHFNVINDYLDRENKRVEKLKNDLVAIQEWLNHNITETNCHQYNHLNAVQLITRIYRKKSKIVNCIDSKQSLEAFSTINDTKEVSDMQLLYAHRGIRRLQQFYQISASDMASGRYGDRIIGDQLSTCDCYIITENCFRENDVYGATDWAVQTYYRWLNDGQPICVDINKLEHYLNSSSAYTGINYLSLISSDYLHRSEITPNLTHHYFLMSNGNAYFDQRTRRTFDLLFEYYYFQTIFLERKFKDLCISGESSRTLTNESKCRYQTKNSSYRILMPFKEEDVHNKDPIIKIYHDVVYNTEINKVKSFGPTIMYDAKVRGLTGGVVVELTRSNQVGWISKNMTQGHLNALDKRIADFTGLYTESAESYQLANYGLGGFYNPHLDSFPRNHVFQYFGNRLATVLFYLNDVQDGGHTVFPKLEIVSPVEKGAALVWYNVNPSNGNEYGNSVHGSCPIITGNKWILTKWLLEEGQNILTYDWKKISNVTQIKDT